ncbi:MAG: type III pantothenate kinase [Ruminococcus sp.]|nr:type III pantothenate kinase [Ruminococcus sp.]
MLLCTDVGNTNIKFALYKGEKLLMKLRFSTNHSKTADDYAVDLFTIFQINNVKADEISGSIISSVVPIVTEPLRMAIKTVTGIESMLVGPGLKTGLNIRLDNPAAVGSDIVCTCVAIKEQYPCPAIVVGLGTATTILYINSERSYCGGTILPGVQVSLDALTSHAALLPSVNITDPKKVIGTNTADCIKSGIIYGNASMIDGMIERYEEEVGEKCFHIATGGFASVVIKHCKNEITVNDDLILEGLKIIYNKNSIQ